MKSCVFRMRRVESVGPTELFDYEETDFLRCEDQLVVDFNCSQCSFSKLFDNFQVGKILFLLHTITRFGFQ